MNESAPAVRAAARLMISAYDELDRSGHPLTRTAFIALLTLAAHEEEDITFGMLCRMLKMEQSNLANVFMRLRAAGLAITQRRAQRRGAPLKLPKLTPRARAIFHAASARL